jgi:uncharacterized protein YcbK (DUF882 family)
MSKWTYFKEEEVRGLEPEFVAKLDMARHKAGIPFIITSGKREPGDNATVGGVQDSAHLQGRAVDLHSSDSRSHYKIIKAALETGINRVGYYTDGHGTPTHVHLDDSSTLPQEVIWPGVSH